MHAIDYYTGLVFRGYLWGLGDVVLSGGRYDTLSEAFDMKLSSTGFAVDVDSIVVAAKRAGPNKKAARARSLPFDRGFKARRGGIKSAPGGGLCGRNEPV